MGGANLLGAAAMGNAGMMNLLNAPGLVGGSLGAGLAGTGFNSQVLTQLGVELSCVTNQVFVTNVSGYEQSIALTFVVTSGLASCYFNANIANKVFYY